MKKRMLYQGLILWVAGELLAVCGLLIPVLRPHALLLWGMGLALVLPALFYLNRYVRWTSPDATAEDQRQMREYCVRSGDERRIMLWDKARGISWTISAALLLVTMPLLTALELSGDTPPGHIPLMALYGLLLVHMLSAMAAYRFFSRRL